MVDVPLGAGLSTHQRVILVALPDAFTMPADPAHLARDVISCAVQWHGCRRVPSFSVRGISTSGAANAQWEAMSELPAVMYGFNGRRPMLAPTIAAVAGWQGCNYSFVFIVSPEAKE